MAETLEIPFSDTDKRDLEAFRSLEESEEAREDFVNFVFEEEKTEKPAMKRQRVKMPSIQASTEKTREVVEEALDSGGRVPRGREVQLDPGLVESIKAAFTSTGGNISKVAAMYDMTPEAIMRLATREEWPVYEASTDVMESKSRSQLQSLKDRIWKRIENTLDSLEIEDKEKLDIVQHRTQSKYVEPLSARNSAFKTLMDQYMRLGAILEPELYGLDPEGSGGPRASGNYPGGVEGVNREMADFLSQVVVGIHDRVKGKEKEMDGYGQIIDARSVNE